MNRQSWPGDIRRGIKILHRSVLLLILFLLPKKNVICDEFYDSPKKDPTSDMFQQFAGDLKQRGSLFMSKCSTRSLLESVEQREDPSSLFVVVSIWSRTLLREMRSFVIARLDLERSGKLKKRKLVASSKSSQREVPLPYLKVAVGGGLYWCFGWKSTPRLFARKDTVQRGNEYCRPLAENA